jgi:pimeloyl-ACP methyl ester carboxylesterase
MLVGSEAPVELVDAVAAAVRCVEPRVLANRAREMLTINVQDLAPAIAVPVLYLAGSADRLVGRRGLAQIQAGLPTMRSVVIPGPHLLLQTKAADSTREIVQFAAGL